MLEDTTFTIAPATPDDSAAIAALAVALLDEISAAVGNRQFDVDEGATAVLCRELLIEGRYTVLLARAGATPVGFAGLSEGRALYAGGAVGTIEELYVVPGWRMRGTGTALLEAVARHAQAHGWRRTEVCTPPLPAFDRTLAFYERHGFAITGGRKLKRLETGN